MNLWDRVEHTLQVNPMRRRASLWSHFPSGVFDSVSGCWWRSDGREWKGRMWRGLRGLMMEPDLQEMTVFSRMSVDPQICRTTLVIDAISLSFTQRSTCKKSKQWNFCCAKCLIKIDSSMYDSYHHKTINAWTISPWIFHSSQKDQNRARELGGLTVPRGRRLELFDVILTQKTYASVLIRTS